MWGQKTNPVYYVLSSTLRIVANKSKCMDMILKTSFLTQTLMIYFCRAKSSTFPDDKNQHADVATCDLNGNSLYIQALFESCLESCDHRRSLHVRCRSCRWQDQRPRVLVHSMTLGNVRGNERPGRLSKCTSERSANVTCLGGVYKDLQPLLILRMGKYARPTQQDHHS